MDTITQAALGASVGQAFFGRKLGRKANWFGALGGLMPDFDVITNVFLGPWGSLVWHRGPTHAVWFGPVLGPLLGYACWRWYRRKSERAPPGSGPDPGAPEALSAWMGLWVLALFTHPLLDVFTSYGTQLLSPFSDTRFTLNGVGIVDPIYTFTLAAALLVGWRSRKRPARAMRAAQVALVLTTAFLFYGTWLNREARATVAAQLADAGLEPERLHVTPTVLQPWLRRVTAWYPDRVDVGFISMWAPHPVEWVPVERQFDPAVDVVLASPNGQIWRWFSDDQMIYRFEHQADGTTVAIEDFRFGLSVTPQQGLWRIEAKVVDGQLVEGPTRVRERPRGDMGQAWDDLWSRTFP